MINYIETNKITSVTEYDDSYQVGVGGWVLVIFKKHNAEPKVGDKLSVHTLGGPFGRIRGIELNDKIVFYTSDEEIEIGRELFIIENNREKLARYNENKEELDQQYQNLPQEFKDRIDHFAEIKENFHLEELPYELFCCEQAVIIANHCKTVENIYKLKELNSEEQLIELPELTDSHSGNTFSCACYLAKIYLTTPNELKNIQPAFPF